MFLTLRPRCGDAVQLRHEVDDLVMAQEEGLRAAATGVAQRLRDAGRRVDLVLEPKRLKWAFKQAERCNAGGWVGGRDQGAGQQLCAEDAKWQGLSARR